MTDNTANSNWIDVTVPLKEGMAIWPGDIKIEIERRHSMERGDAANNSAIHFGVHTGTHMDAPRHFIAKGKSIDQLPFNTSVGPARVIEIKDQVSIKPAELKQYNPALSKRIFAGEAVVPEGAKLRVPISRFKRLLSRTEVVKGITNYVKFI